MFARNKNFFLALESEKDYELSLAIVLATKVFSVAGKLGNTLLRDVVRGQKLDNLVHFLHGLFLLRLAQDWLSRLTLMLSLRCKSMIVVGHYELFTAVNNSVCNFTGFSINRIM